MRDILTSPRIQEIKKRRRNRKIRSVFVYLIFILTLIGAASYYSYNQYITINNITVDGQQIINKEEIEKNIEDTLSGKYIYLFSRANSFIYPNKEIYNNLLKEFTRIETLNISHSGLNTLNVKIKERKGSFLYCGPIVPKILSEIGENCYFVNNDGYIFDKAPYFSGNVYFKYYLKIEEENPLGAGLMKAEEFHNLVRFIDNVKKIGFNSNYIVVDQDQTVSLYLDHFTNNTSPIIIFKIDSDLDILLDNLTLSMNKKEFSDEINQKYSKLLYIDLRFKNKVLYKFEQ